MTRVLDMFSGLSEVFDARYQNDPNFIQRMEAWTACIDSYLAPGELVYDLGCGPGVFSFYAASRGGRVTGMDGSAGMINLCREKLSKVNSEKPLQLSFVEENLPLKEPGKYPRAQLIICSSMFEYIQDKEKMIACFSSLLKEDGILLLSVPNRQSVYRFFERSGYALFKKPAYLEHVHHQFALPELKEDFAEQFQILESRYYANRYFLSGLWNRLLPAKYTCNLLLVAFRQRAGKSL